MMSIECMTCPGKLHVRDETEIKAELDETEWIEVVLHIRGNRKPIREHMCPECVAQRKTQAKYIRQVSKHGNGAHIIVPKEFMDKTVRLLINDAKV